MTSAARVFIEGVALTYAQIGERLNIGNSAAYNRVLRLQAAKTPLTWLALGERAAISKAGEPEPSGWTQRILAAVAKARSPQSLDQVVAAVDDGSMAPAKLTALVSTLLSQSFGRGKLDRTGKYRDYRYRATATTLVDGRHRARGQQPSERTRPQPKPKKPTPAPRAKKPVAPAAPVQRERVLKPRQPTPRNSTEPETVDQFLKRGGRIQKLKPGESSTPLFESVRAMNDRTMRKRLAAEPDNDLIDDDEPVAA